jgi:anti-sigma factor ChrR (cupin superfamily)
MNRRHPAIPLAREAMAPEELEEAEAHLRSCAVCAARMRALSAALLEGDVTAASIEPHPKVRERLLASIGRAPRLEGYVEPVARLLDVPPSKARDYLWRIDDATRWRPMPFAGVEALFVKGGSHTAGAFTAFLRVQAGYKLPMHDHLGPERGLLLQGRARDQDGCVHAPGAEVEMQGGTSHEFEALPIVDCVFLVIAHRGVRFGELEFRTDALG